MGNQSKKAPPDQTPNLTNEQRINIMLQQNADNDSIFYTLSRLPINLQVHQDSTTREKLANKFGIPCPTFDKVARQRLLEQIRKCKSAYLKAHGELIAEETLKEDDGSAMPISAIDKVEIKRFSTGIAALDDMLGESDNGQKGLVEGTCLLFGAGKGIGKTRLTVQVAAHVGRPNAVPDEHGNCGVLYIQNEEKLEVFRSRAARCWSDNHKILLSSSDNLTQHAALVDKHRPKLIIIDSIQDTRQSRFHAGLINMLVTYKSIASSNRCTFWLISHVNTQGKIKGGTYTGHKVDIEMTAERVPFNPSEFVINCNEKNRYGSTNKKVIFVHTDQGVVPIEDGKSRKLSMNSANMNVGAPAQNRVVSMNSFIGGTVPIIHLDQADAAIED
jgi:predicted ATP-dependent serine protease